MPELVSEEPEHCPGTGTELSGKADACEVETSRPGESEFTACLNSRQPHQLCDFTIKFSRLGCNLGLRLSGSGDPCPLEFQSSAFPTRIRPLVKYEYF